MRILIVEDEVVIARRLERLVRELLGKRLDWLGHETRLDEAWSTLEQTPIDLLFLDLNLNGKDGFQLLERAVAGSFHTVVVSAYTDQALRAFEYGVLDFVAKPFDGERLAKTLDRLDNARERADYGTRYLGVAKPGRLALIPVAEIRYIKGAGAYSELHSGEGPPELHGKSLDRLMAILPPIFERVHKSYIVHMDRVRHIRALEGSRYELHMDDGTVLPVGRTRIKQIRARLQ